MTVTRPLTITELQQIAANRGKLKRDLHERIRRGIDEMNEVLVRNWSAITEAYQDLEDDFNFRGPVFAEIVKRFAQVDSVTGWRLLIRWNPTKLAATGLRTLQVRIDKSPPPPPPPDPTGPTAP